MAAILKMAAILAIPMKFGLNFNITSHEMLKGTILQTYIEFTETIKVLVIFPGF